MTGLLVASLIVISLISGTCTTLYVFKKIWLDVQDIQ
jgi:hypothetical protein